MSSGSDTAYIHRGDAQTLHDRPIVANAGVEVLEIVRSAVVLGSTQAFDVVDTARAEALGFDVVRRRSGGGVVVLHNGGHVWVDVTVPRGHVLWDDDVERATWWVGDMWCAALSAEIPDTEWSVHRGRLVATAPERAVCFASVGPGEVVHEGCKVVGISQRRTKDAARFQCTVFRHIDVDLHRQLLHGDIPPLLQRARGIGDALESVQAHVVAALTAALARST